MSLFLMQTVAEAMNSLGINYAFGVNTDNPIKYPYFVGEYRENTPLNEDGMIDGTFILNGFTRNTWMELEQQRQLIAEHFNKVNGLVKVDTDGKAVAIYYGNTLIIPTGDEEFKRIQINLIYKEWSVN